MRRPLKQSFIASHIASMGAVSMESLAFQSDLSFFKELTALFTEMKGMKQSVLSDGDVAARMRKVITKHTGLNVMMDFGDWDPCVEIPMVSKNNVLINSFIRNFLNSNDGLKMINDAGEAVRGTVNIKTGKVSGVFSDIESTIHLPIYMLVSTKFDAEEMAAITLHEVGHLFTYYEFMSRSVTTNQCLAGMAKALDGSSSIEQRESVLMSVREAMNLKDMDVKELAKSNAKNVIDVVVITNIAKNAESELGSNVYDFSTWEYLADQYAARQGAGRYIVTGLEKLYKGSFNISFRSTPSFLAMEAFKAMMMIAPVIAVGTPALAGLAGGFLNLVFMLIAMDGAGDGTYDRPGARFKRVRNQVIENLKDRKLPRDTQERLQADLVAIDEVLHHVNDRRQLLGVIWDTVSPSARRAWNQFKLQRELEDIAANDLFVQASKLKTMA